METPLHLSTELEQRLTQFAQDGSAEKLGRLREAILDEIEDLVDYHLAGTGNASYSQRQRTDRCMDRREERAWPGRIEISAEARKSLSKFDKPVSKRIGEFLNERLANLDDPRQIGEALRGEELGKYWKYRRRRLAHYRQHRRSRDYSCRIASWQSTGNLPPSIAFSAKHASHEFPPDQFDIILADSCSSGRVVWANSTNPASDIASADSIFRVGVKAPMRCL